MNYKNIPGDIIIDQNELIYTTAKLVGDDIGILLINLGGVLVV